MSVERRVKSTVVDPENIETFPGLSVAPVSVTSAERMLTLEGGVSVIARTTDELPEDVPCEEGTLPAPERQPAIAAQEISNVMIQNDRGLNMVPLSQSCKRHE